jgi:hypothetical protein
MICVVDRLRKRSRRGRGEAAGGVEEAVVEELKEVVLEEGRERRAS